MRRLKNLAGESIDAVYMGRGLGYYGSRIAPLWVVVGIRNRAQQIRDSKWEALSVPRESLNGAAEEYNNATIGDTYAGLAIVCVNGVWGALADGPRIDGHVVRTTWVGPVYSETHPIGGGRQLPNLLGMEEAVRQALATAFPDWRADLPPEQPAPKNLAVGSASVASMGDIGMTVPPVEDRSIIPLSELGGEQ